MKKKIAIIGSGIAGVSLIKAFTDLKEKNLSSSMKDVELAITLIEKEENIFQTYKKNASGNPVAVIHYPVTKNAQLLKLCIFGQKKTKEWLLNLEKRYATIIYNTPGLIHIPKNIPEEQKWKDIFHQNAFYEKYFIDENFTKTLSSNLSLKIGLWDSSGIWLNPRKFMFFCLKDSLKKNHENISVIYKTKISGLECADKGVLLTGKKDGHPFCMNFDKVIIASGSGVKDILDNSSFYKESSGKVILNDIPKMDISTGQMTKIYLDKNNSKSIPKFIFCKGGYVTPKINNCIYSGSTYESTVNNDPFIIKNNNLINLKRVEQFLKTNIEKRFIKHRRSERCISGDRMPLAGRVKSSKTNDVFLLTALGSRGFSYAPLLSEIIAKEIFEDFGYSYLHKEESIFNDILRMVVPSRIV